MTAVSICEVGPYFMPMAQPKQFQGSMQAGAAYLYQNQWNCHRLANYLSCLAYREWPPICPWSMGVRCLQTLTNSNDLYRHYPEMAFAGRVGVDMAFRSSSPVFKRQFLYGIRYFHATDSSMLLRLTLFRQDTRVSSLSVPGTAPLNVFFPVVMPWESLYWTSHGSYCFISRLDHLSLPGGS